MTGIERITGGIWYQNKIGIIRANTAKYITHQGILGFGMNRNGPKSE
jgi:hypothetical protein